MNTAINKAKLSSTKLNNSLAKTESLNLEGKNIINNKYTLLLQMSVLSGEADLYICTDKEGHKFVAKLYRRKDAIKPEVLHTIKKLNSPYVAQIIDIGEFDGYPVTVLPYFRNGSLAGKTFDYGTIRNIIIPNVAKGLKILHDNGIIHKDIKPSNLMISDDGERIKIIDFGISSFTDDSQSIVITKTGFSPEYNAPETFNNVFLNESDYYSFGITLYELFSGYTPFSNTERFCNVGELAASASVQNIPFPESLSFPERLKILIKGLTYRDLSHRNEPDNPNRRWTWSEVEMWINDADIPSPGEINISQIATTNSNSGCVSNYVDLPFSQIYDFRDCNGKIISLHNLTDFVEAFGTNWKEGKKHIGRGLVSEFYKKLELRSVSSIVIDCEEAGITDTAYSKMLLEISSGIGTAQFYWNSRKISSLRNLAEYLNDCLVNDTITKNEYDSSMQMLQYWCKLNNEESQLQIIEKLQLISKANEFNFKTAIISFCSYLSKAMQIKLGNKVFKDVCELREYADSLKKSNTNDYFDWITDNANDFVMYGTTNVFNSKNDNFYSDFNNQVDKLIGSILSFGKYYFKEDNDKVPLRWRVLAKDFDRILLITEKAIDFLPFTNYKGNNTWERSSLRDWLNRIFFKESFTESDRVKILKLEHKNKNEPNTLDSVFIFDDDEAKIYLKSEKERRCDVTPFSKSRVSAITRERLGCWWLRTRSGLPSDSKFAYVGRNGCIYGCGNNHDEGLDMESSCSVRPALWISLNFAMKLMTVRKNSHNKGANWDFNSK